MKRIIIYGALTFISFAFSIPAFIYLYPFYKTFEVHNHDLALNVAAFGFISAFVVFVAFYYLFDFFCSFISYLKNKKKV